MTASAPDLPMPTGKPVANWEGIPVMPIAIAGDGDSQGYSFTIMASPDEVQAFYENAMPKLGWNILAVGKGKTETVMLIFTKGSSTASVSILPQADNLLYILLVKS
jgi:hypothetical protein